MGTADDRVSFLTRRRARGLSEAARAALARAPVVDDDGRHARTQVVGVDPVRILLFGSGPLIGYGVDRRQDAVDGHLAELVAQRTGRGVSVESRVRLRLPIDEAVRSLGGAGAATFAVAIWSPRFGEELEHGRPERARAGIRAMLHEFREGSEVPLILCGLPTPLGADWRTRMRRPRIAAFNRVLDEEAATVRCTTAVSSGRYRPAEVAVTLDTTWHRQLAEHLAPAVLAAVEGSSRSRTSLR